MGIVVVYSELDMKNKILRLNMHVQTDEKVAVSCDEITGIHGIGNDVDEALVDLIDIFDDYYEELKNSQGGLSDHLQKEFELMDNSRFVFCIVWAG